MEHAAVLAATDLRPESDDAIRQALAAARGRHRVAICHVLPEVRRVRSLFPQLHSDDATAALDLQAWAREELERTLSRVGSPDVDVYFETGAPFERIVERAESLGAELIVVGMPEAAPRATGTAQRVVRTSKIPVLLTRSSGPGPVLATIDLADPSIATLELAKRQATSLGVDLHVIHVADLERETGWLAAVRRVSGSANDAYAARIREAIERAGAELGPLLARHAPGAKGRVDHGRAAEVVCRHARDLGASLIVVATHGRGGLDRLLDGSVAEDIVAQAPCSVLAVRHVS